MNISTFANILASLADEFTMHFWMALVVIGFLTALVIMLALNILRRRQAADALQRSEQELQLTLEATTDGIWKWNFITNTLFFSPRYYTMLGYEPNEFPASFENWKALIHPDDRDRALAAATEYLAAKPDYYENEFRFRTRSGEYRWVHSSARVVERDERGEAVRMIGDHVDITERKRAEARLARSEAFLQTIYDHAEVSLYLVDVINAREYVYAGINAMHEKLMGVSSDWIAGKTPDDLRTIFDDTTVAFIYDLYNQCVAARQTIQLEHSAQLHGEPTWWLSTITPLFDEDQRVYRLIGTGLNITARKRIEQALRESEERFKTVIEDLPGGVFVHDRNGHLLLVNEKACQNTGYSREELLTMTVADIDPTSVIRDDRVRLWHRPDMDKSVTFETTHIRKNGSHCPVEVHVNTILLKGQPVILGIAIDITERKHAEEALRESEEKFRTLFEAALNPILMVDENGRYTDANQAACQFLECDRAELLGKQVWDFAPAGQLERQQQEHAPFVNHRTLETEYWVHGTTKTLLLNVVPLEVNGRTILYGIGQDITARKQAEEQLKAALREKTVLLREVHHRTLNNMQVMSALIHFQTNLIEDEATLQMFQVLRARIDAMSLVHQQLHHGDLTNVNLDLYLKALAQMLMDRYRSPSGKIAFRWDTETLCMTIDPAVRCGLLLYEVLSNAVRHAFPGERSGEIRVSAHTSAAGEREIRVRDTGVGLPAGFDVQQTNTLGFRLIRMFIEHLDGTLEVSRRDPGTEVLVRFTEPYYKPRI